MSRTQEVLDKLLTEDDEIIINVAGLALAKTLYKKEDVTGISISVDEDSILEVELIEKSTEEN